MNDSQPRTSADWIKLANNNLYIVEQLCNTNDAKTYSTICEKLALSAECLMKSIIIQRLRLNCWPEKTRDNTRTYYTHNLSILLHTANLKNEFESAEFNIQAAFNTLRQHKISERYSLEPVSGKYTQDMLDSYTQFRLWIEEVCNLTK